MKLTIVTINYNDKTGLLKTFNSIFNQSNSEFEYIVIDGGSTDGSVDLIKENSNKINFFIFFYFRKRQWCLQRLQQGGL